MRILLILCFLTPLYIFSQSTIQRVEPPNWWVGMKTNNIQLLVHGKDIGNLRPSIQYPGVHIINSHAVENPNFLFINLRIHETAKPGKVEIEFSGQGKEQVSYTWDLQKREAGREELQGFDASDAICLITPDRFANGTTSNDNILGYRETANRSNKGGRHGGDIQGLHDNLDYFKEMGFTAIWLNPLLENDMEEYSYHGYSTTDFYKVDPRYGSNADYKALADGARAKGMGLIMDMIVNHCGSFHWWMDDKPTKDWINEWDNMTYTNHRKTVLQDPYVSQVDKKQFTDGWFVSTMPDLNQRNPFMAKYLIQNAIWWIEYLGLAGIRMDTYPYPDEDFMTEWTEVVMKEYPDFNVVGEEWFGQPTIVSYWQRGKQNPNGYTSELTSVMDFPIQSTFNQALVDKEDWGSGFIKVYEMLAQDFLYPDPYNLVIFPDNHDMMRIYSQLNEDYDKFKQAMVFYLTIRGVPQLYYGTEILMTSSSDHGIIRSDFPGGWAKDSTNAFVGTGLTNQQKTAQDFTKQLLNWRQTATATHTGKLKHFIPQDGIYVYFRFNEDQKIMVVLSKNMDTKTLDLNRFAEMLEGEAMATDVLSGKTFRLGDTMEVPGNGALILELK